MPELMYRAKHQGLQNRPHTKFIHCHPITFYRNFSFWRDIVHGARWPCVCEFCRPLLQRRKRDKLCVCRWINKKKKKKNEPKKPERKTQNLFKASDRRRWHRLAQYSVFSIQHSIFDTLTNTRSMSCLSLMRKWFNPIYSLCVYFSKSDRIKHE